jgi:dUTP pyrophosphatase
MKMVKFEKVNKITEDIKLPERSTLNSAGYDFFAIEDVTLPAKKLTRVMTGIKCELMPNQVLILANRSSNPSKKGLILVNGVGIIDADYYNNPDNDGEMGFEFYNILDEDVVIKKGEKLGQGIIMKFDKTEDDYISNPYKTRVGGFGSTGK